MTANHITRRQHYVPDFYMQGWTAPDGTITVHNLFDKKVFRTNPKNALVQSYFYEEDPDSPDNRIENILATMEGRASSVIEKIRATTTGIEAKKAAKDLEHSLSSGDLDILAEFAAYQYLRVPGAIEQKKYELEASALSESDKTHHLNPGRFVESGYSYIVDKFKTMKFLLFVSSGQDFITSDWPCFDADEDNKGTALGEEVGSDPGVVVYMPLTPRVGAVMYLAGLTKASLISKRLGVNAQPDMFAKNQNTLVIQKAERYVVATREQPFIFKVASKRRKSRVS